MSFVGDRGVPFFENGKVLKIDNGAFMLSSCQSTDSPVGTTKRNPGGGRTTRFVGRALACLAVLWAAPIEALPQCPSLVLNGATAYATASHTVFPNTTSLVSFTVEAWIYPTAIPSGSKIIVSEDAYDLRFEYSGVAANGGLGIRMTLWESQSNTLSAVEYRNVALNQWNHIALVFDAGAKQARLFINGVAGSPLNVTLTSFGTFTNNFIVGAFSSTQSLFKGYIDDVRVSDVPRYTANFTPPDSLTADANTRALYSFSEAPDATTFADASVYGHTLTAGGGAQAGNSPTTGCAPVITTQPRSQSIASADTATMSVVAIGTTPSTYQWYAGTSGTTSNPIAGATSSNYTTPALPSTATYWVNVSNANGSAPSNTATVTVLAAGVSFVVDSTLDVIDAAPGNGVCATAGGVCTLRAAIQEANALPGSHVITLPAGAYTLTIAGRGEFSAATGDLNIQGNIRINGAGSSTTIINANGLDRVFRCFSGGLTLNDLTVQNGNPDNVFGGDIYVSGVNLTLNRVAVKSGNSGFSFGGGISAFGPSTVIVTDTTITQNAAGSGSGGGLYLSGTTATFNRTTISGNSALFGGGIYVLGPSTMTFLAGTIAQNTSTFGGGGLYLSETDATTAIAATLANTTVSGNTTIFYGGAIYKVDGGAIYMGGVAGSVTLRNDTIASNSSGFTGAVVVSGSSQFQLKNTIIANSAGTASSNCGTQGSGLITDLGNNLEFPGTSCGFALASDRRADPLLGALAANGGSTLTYALGVGSPALDAGDDASCAAAPVSGVDQRGGSRPKGAHCDIGAYEASVPFTDDPLVAGSSVIRAVHITELRTRIDALRARFGLAGFTWTDLVPTSLPVTAMHIQEMRSALVAAYSAASQTPPSFTDDPLIVGQTVIKAVHLTQLRTAVAAIE